MMIAAVSLISCMTAHGTQKTLTEQWGNLEGEWRFRTDPAEIGEREGWQNPDAPDTGWRTLRVPGGWEAQGVTDPRPGRPPQPRDIAPWTDYDGVAWYRLRVRIPAAWRGQDLTLVLGSVDDEDRAYFNGKRVGETGPGVKQAVQVHRSYRIPAALARFGEENTLAIRVKDYGGPGGLMGPFVSLLPRRLLETPVRVPGANRSLLARFAEPAAETRILKIIHSWPDAPEAQDTLIRQLAAQGFGGVVCNVSFTDYLTSEAHGRAFVRAVRQAKAAGMTLWLYDERGYPSGLAGGQTLKGHPEWEARGLLIRDRDCRGAAEVEVPPGRLVLASAYPLTRGQIDLSRPLPLTGSVQNGRLRAVLPAGEWRVIVMTEDRLYEGTHAQMSLADKLPYINLLEAPPTARFIALTHDRYARWLGSDLGRWFAATFTDEPSLMSLFMRPMPYRVLPWSRSLPAEFRKRRGRALEPLLPALTSDAGPQGQRARYEFWLTVAELVSENYFGQIQRWGRRHNIPSGGHLLMEESLVSHVPLYGDFFRGIRRMDAPGIDCLTSVPSEVPWQIARLIGSAADLDKRALTMCETSDFVQVYRPPGDTRPIRQVTEAEIRGTCNRLLLGGINTITSYYTFQGLTSEEIRRLNLWVGRCSTLLRGGHQVTDIAMLYPAESLWTRFLPSHRNASESPAAAQVESVYQTAGDSLYAARRDFTFIDSRTLTEAKAQDGALTLGALRWRVVVLPCADTLPLAAWENLARFWRGGGVVAALGARPANTPTEFPSARVQRLAKEIFGEKRDPSVNVNAKGGVGIWLPAGTESLLPVALDAVLEPDVRLSDRQTPIRAAHRRVGGREVYFLINDSNTPWQGAVSLSTRGAGEQWNPETGTVTRIAGGQNVRLRLPPYGATLLRFAAARTPERRAVKSGSLPGLALETLTSEEPVVGAGEFVQASLTPERGGWSATGTLKRGQTDTHLFLSFRFAKPRDLREMDGLVIRSVSPEGQKTPVNLLILLHERDGGIYVADTGRPLSLSGSAQSVLPWSRFHSAPWAKDPNGRLDLESIVAVSVGWGGYYGVEGERVAFLLTPPQVFRLPRGGR
jgi:hypothetical protein